MKSMTGFASVSDENYFIKIKSVNHRFFDFRFHGPQDFLFLEKDIRNKVNQIASRGSVDLFVQYSLNVENDKSLDLDKAQKFHKELKKLYSSLKVNPQDEVKSILTYGDVFTKKSKFEDSFKKNVFMKLIDEALKEFDVERSREGEGLRQELVKLLDELELVRVNLEQLAKNYPKEIEHKLKDKIKLWNEEINSDRLNQELLFMIDKSDIAEEVVRLKEHIKACLKLAKSKSSEGKKLDFYAQELFREVNTIGSKSSSVKITGEVMQAKAIIEKIRQQVQNLE